MKCCRCGKPAMVHLEGVGDYCIDCFNRREEALAGVEHVEHAPLAFSFDSQGGLRVFDVERLVMGLDVTWTARERGVKDGYEFKLGTGIDDDVDESLMLLYDRIDKGLSHRSMELSDVPERLRDGYWPRAVWRKGQQLHLSDSGTARICDDVDGNVFLVIDGQRVEGDEFVKLLSTYCGFTLKWRFCDPYDDSDELPL